ncbi:uncharacterized protein LOC126427142 [Schistocerca serialis cubense]|uniref:uncharacterized protein LOC126427142 n=1 Tax=Schistocerca serialis cubense TaxID=2023355 RepID=UPI00214E3148|nr:uncharacterized protein LOC126427142 [Schistocerca serialis cubense]XP_049945325.1 uncharacterized protein LOC126427142 [Schistocerca serialis cubense]
MFCHHNTVSKRVHDTAVHPVTKNTNCPSKMMIKIHVVHERTPSYKYRGKFAGIIDIYRQMPCEMKLTLNHNHSIDSAASLKYRKPSREVQETLISLFQKGHSPASALQCIKTDIQLNHSDYPLVLGDRSQCPDYKFCYNLYRKTLEKDYGPMDFNEGKEFLQQRLLKYNTEVRNVCCKMVMKDADYIICIYSPLMKKVHMCEEMAPEMVFIDSTGSLDHNGSRVFVLLTPSACGGLLLGIIVTSSESCEVLQIGFQLLKEIVGKDTFGGNIDGPHVFLTDDCKSEQNAIIRSFPRSTIVLCIFHVMQAVWRWLIKTKHGIPQDKQMQYFKDFKKNHVF